MAVKLTDKSVKALPIKPTIVFDDQLPGFGVRVAKSGTKTFLLDYRINGRQRRYSIGQYNAWSVAAAREQAGKLRRLVDQGEDPLADRKAKRTEPTVSALCDRYLDDYARHNKRPASVEQDERHIKQYIKPAIGRRKVSSITFADMDGLHRKISQSAPVLANRIAALLSKMFNLAIRWQLRTDNPTKGLQRNQEQKRERYLSGDELRRVCVALADYPYMHKARLSRAEALEKGAKSEWRKGDKPAPDRLQSCNAIRLLMLTGARKGELLGAKWANIDLQAGVWTKPGATTKQKTTHRVPLSAPAIQLLAGLNQTNDYVFPGDDDEHQKDLKKTWASICELAEIEGVRVHDLRHTYAAQLVSAGLSLPIIGALLGHTKPDTTARYAHLMDDPLREATERVGAIVSNANGKRADVVNLRGQNNAQS